MTSRGGQNTDKQSSNLNRNEESSLINRNFVAGGSPVNTRFDDVVLDDHDSSVHGAVGQDPNMIETVAAHHANNAAEDILEDDETEAGLPLGEENADPHGQEPDQNQAVKK